MSTGFSILPASTSVPLDAADKGAASFTVTNQTGHAVRVRVTVTLLGNPATPKEWIIPPEVTERDLAIDGAQQFTVLVAVPPNSPGGTYLFRMDAVSTVLPDEEWAHSPEVHFVVPEPQKEPEPEPQKPPPITRKGYVESVIGCEIGAVGLGLLFGVPGRILREVGLGDIGGLLSIIAPIAFWIGSFLGVVWYLRRTQIEGAYETALPTGLIVLPWALVVGVVVLALAEPLGGIPGANVIGPIIAGFLIALVPPLPGRAIFRYRTYHTF
jgi:hypothetical protein